VQNTNSSSPRPKQKHSGAGLSRSILVIAGRSLLWTGGRIQAVGATLIFKAEAGERIRMRPVLAFAAAVAVVVGLVLIANASVQFGSEPSPSIQRATAW